MSTHTIRIFLVEDDQEMLDMMRATLTREADLSIVGAFGNGSDFLKKYPEREADVVIMDIGLPDMSGIDCVAQAKPLRPATQFLMSTIFENPAYTFRALSAGATGYLLKNAAPERLVEAIRELHTGGSPMSPAIARMVIGSFQGQLKNNIQDHALTEREKEILDQLAQGLMYKEIAIKLSISVETVRRHARNIYEKLQVGSRMAAIEKVYPKGR
ncbi:MAG: response regulator transcription factor [Flavobacteriales bacterium]